MTDLKIEISGYDLVEAIIEDGDLFDKKEFSDAVIAIVEDEIDRKVEKKIEGLDISDIVRDAVKEEMPDHQDDIDDLQREIDDLKDAIKLRDENYNGFIKEVEKEFNTLSELNVKLFKTIEHLEKQLDANENTLGAFILHVRSFPIIGRFFYW